MTPTPPGGLAPLSVGFTLTSLVAVADVRLDLRGTGSVDFQGPALEGQEFVYAEPGVYTPTVKVIDANQQEHRATTLVHVYDRGTLDARLQAIWQGFRDALRGGDVTAALSFVHTDRRSVYERQLRQLTPAVLSSVDQYLPAIRLFEVGFAGAQYEMLRQRDGKTLSFGVWFQLDADGVWRLRRF